MKTVKELITELENWVNSGHLDEDSPVYICDDFLACYQDAPVYDCHIVAAAQPVFDKENPTKQACFICPFGKVETDYDVIEKETRYKYRKQKK